MLQHPVQLRPVAAERRQLRLDLIRDVHIMRRLEAAASVSIKNTGIKLEYGSKLRGLWLRPEQKLPLVTMRLVSV